MPAYIVVDIDVKNPETYARYRDLAPPSIAQYGGRYIVRGGKADILEGDWLPNRFVVIEFPDVEKARAWWASREYAEAKALRQSCADSRMIVIEGL